MYLSITEAQSIADLAAFFRDIGFDHFLWQLRKRNELYTWDAMPIGFLAHYYGTNLDQACGVAEAVRQHWQSFTFKEARRRFRKQPGADDAESLFRAFGINDGAIFFAGRNQENSALVLCSSGNAADIIADLNSVLTVAAWKVHMLLNDNPGLSRVPKTLVQLSQTQLDLLWVQIDNPGLTLEEQAEIMTLPLPEIIKCHTEISGIFSVSNFASSGTRTTNQ